MRKKILEKADLFMTVGLGLIVFAVYFGTSDDGVGPAGSAAAAEWGSGVTRGMRAGHPLWGALSRAAACLPVRGAASTQTLLNAVCGAAAVGLLFRVAKRFLDELTRPLPELRDVADEGAEGKCPDDEVGDAGRQKAVTVGGVVAAVSFAFCAPFWRASASPSVHPVDILLLLLLADLLLRCCFSPVRCETCAAAMFLCGAGVIETSLFLLLLPVTMALVVRAVIRSENSESGVPLCLLAGLAGLSASLGLAVLQYAPGTEDGGCFLREYARMYRVTVCQGFRPSGVFLIWAVPAATFAITAAGVRRVAFSEEGVGTGGRLFLGALTGGTVATLLNLPHTAWAVSGAGQCLPTVPALMVALSAGCLFVCWLKTAVLPRYSEECGTVPPSRLARAVSFGMCGLLAVSALVQPFIVYCRQSVG